MKRTELRRGAPMQRKRPSAPGESKARRLVYERSGGICERCAQARGTEWHHRKNRSQAGEWSAENGLHLCGPCHRYITEHPEDALECGWAVISIADPAAEPVLVGGHRWVWLTAEGTTSTEPPAVTA